MYTHLSSVDPPGGLCCANVSIRGDVKKAINYGILHDLISSLAKDLVAQFQVLVYIYGPKVLIIPID